MMTYGFQSNKAISFAILRFAEMSASIRESKDSLFTSGGDSPPNHRVSLYVAGVCGCLLILIIIALAAIPDDLYSTNPKPEADMEPDPSVRSLDALRPPSAGRSYVSGTCEPKNEIPFTVVCQNITQIGNNDFQPGEYIKQRLTEICTTQYAVLGPCRNWKLLIIESSFPRNTISSDWLHVENKTNFPTIARLEIHDCRGLYNIEDGAFADFPFGSALKELTLSKNSQFSEYTAGITIGLTGLLEFNLRENAIMTAIDKKILDPVKSSLTTLQIQGGIDKPELLAKLIGSAQDKLNALVLVDLRFNTLGTGMHDLSADEIGGLTSVQSLYLASSGIETIDVDTFKMISRSLRILDLMGNNLERLQNGTFDALKNSGLDVSLYLKDNYWICDCYLEWLQDMLLDDRSNLILENKTETVCNNPASEKGKLLLEANMTICTEEETTITVPATTKPTTTAAPSAPEFECKSYASSVKFLAGKKSVSKRNHAHFDFTIEEEPDDGKGTPKVVITSSNSDQMLTLVWHDVDDITSLNCKENFNQSFKVVNLTREKTYVFCLVQGKKIDTPSQCQGVTIKPAWESRAWIVNKNMPMWVGIAVAIGVACVIVGAIIVIFALWRKPTLLAVHSRVVKVRTSKTEALVMPKQAKKCKKETQSDDVSIRSDPSYVTVRKANRVSLVAFRFREWLRKVENGEINPTDPYTIDTCYAGCNRDNAVNVSGINTISSTTNL